MNTSPGKFIVIEGPDGSGKSEQAKRLAAYLRDNARTVVLTCEPTLDGPLAPKIQDILKHRVVASVEEIQRLISEDRKEHLERVVLPAISRGEIVISDRYYYSTYAYGSLTTPLERLIDMNRGYPAPDIAFLLDVPAKICMERITQRIDSKEQRAEFFEKEERIVHLVENYRALVARFPELVLIDGNRDPVGIHADIVGKLKSVLE